MHAMLIDDVEHTQYNTTKRAVTVTIDLLVCPIEFRAYNWACMRIFVPVHVHYMHILIDD